MPRHCPAKLYRRTALALLTITLLSAGECSPRRDTNAVTPPPFSAQTFINTTPPACNGGPAAAQAIMNGPAAALAQMINMDRNNTQLGELQPDPVMVGVAQFQAEDMAKHGYVGLVASDGEDAFTRIVCSGGAASTSVGIIATGYSTDPGYVFAALNADYGGFSILYNSTFATSLSVGYSEGYWMIIME